MTAKPSKREEYMRAAIRCLDVARTLPNRGDRVRKRVQAGEWLKLADAIRDSKAAASAQNKA